jgi:4-amino-4-deoxy-L-arabinose transferase-like glycosyltransferase
MLLGAWAVMRAAETGKWRWLLLTAVLVGIGFNIKMLEAYLVVPAYALLYLLAAPRSLKMRIAQLLVAAVVMLTISLSWAVAVDLTPASQRPYVGSSQNNSEISLAIGYNGVQRLLGSFGFGGANGRSNSGAPPTSNGTNTGTPPNNFPRPGSGNGGQPPQGFRGGPGGGGNSGNSGGMFNTGNPGILRLFNEPLGGQIVWLLPLAILGMIALAWQRRPNFREDRRQQSLIVWGVWMLTMAVFFSAASFFHQYYLSTLAPAICALFGIGVVVMWKDYRRSGWRGWLLPLALLLTALEQIHIILSNPSWGTWLIPLIAIPCGLAALILFIARLFPRLKFDARTLIPVLCLGVMALMLTPAVWSTIPVVENIAADLPIAGPTQQFGGSGGPGGQINTNTALIRYLEANQGNAKYLVATVSANEADSIILSTNKPVMALGGFTGSDPILTTSQLANLTTNGTVRFFLIDGNGGPGGGGQSSLTTWIEQHSTVVPASQWQSTSTSTNSGFGGGGTLYMYTASK